MYNLAFKSPIEVAHICRAFILLKKSQLTYLYNNPFDSNLVVWYPNYLKTSMSLRVWRFNDVEDEHLREIYQAIAILRVVV